VDGDFARYLRRLALLALIACAATACGRKGALEPPPKADAAKPGDQKATTDQTASEGEEANAPASTGLQGLRPKKPKPVQPPHQSFILDPLL